MTGCLLFAACYLPGCNNEPKQNNTRKPVDYIKAIPGISDSIPVKIAQKGEVLISYLDCYICHKKDERSVGPAFTDVAKRYPANKVFIEMLAQKVIVGGSGGWGSAVMDAHPKLSFEDAKTMVSYVLSLKNN
ncbi:cytochrome C [Danxiaibacter flavus]|uniref:Cytochrome C n=1 Tax=Danxiaibacter flavus TaxID=3049108 RepID=A0ABV3ZJP6_9BACT|nr:cytochrome C [Chitinophagaceae bacterium DXS]